ncbi:hypothetical protein V3481_006965 [Fusarium oxysporum f. sp. vasinfectum]
MGQRERHNYDPRQIIPGVKGPSLATWRSRRIPTFALGILAIPAMSVDPERTFSVTKLTVSSQRRSISPEIIEEMECLRNWLRHQAITVGEVVSFGGDLVG